MPKQLAHCPVVPRLGWRVCAGDSRARLVRCGPPVIGACCLFDPSTGETTCIDGLTEPECFAAAPPPPIIVTYLPGDTCAGTKNCLGLTCIDGGPGVGYCFTSPVRVTIEGHLPCPNIVQCIPGQGAGCPQPDLDEWYPHSSLDGSYIASRLRDPAAPPGTHTCLYYLCHLAVIDAGALGWTIEGPATCGGQPTFQIFPLLIPLPNPTPCDPLVKARCVFVVLTDGLSIYIQGILQSSGLAIYRRCCTAQTPHFMATARDWVWRPNQDIGFTVLGEVAEFCAFEPLSVTVHVETVCGVCAGGVSSNTINATADITFTFQRVLA